MTLVKASSGCVIVIDTASNSGVSHVPSQPVIVPSSRETHGRGSGLPNTTRDTTGKSGNVFGNPAAQEGSSSALFKSSRNQASFYCEMGPGSTKKTLGPEKAVTREPQDFSKVFPGFQRGSGVFDYTGGTYSHCFVLDYPRFPVSEMHLGRLPDSMEFSMLELQLQD